MYVHAAARVSHKRAKGGQEEGGSQEEERKGALEYGRNATLHNPRCQRRRSGELQLKSARELRDILYRKHATPLLLTYFLFHTHTHTRFRLSVKFDRTLKLSVGI